MPITGQHDVMFMPWMTHFINLGHWNIYSYLSSTYGDIVMHQPAVWAPYPYGFFFSTALWIGLWDKLINLNLLNWNAIWQVAQPARYVFLFKLAYLPFDFAIAYFLYRTAGRFGLILWVWSPAVIYTPFMMGQNDIYATAFCTAGIYFAAKSIDLQNELARIPGKILDRWALLSALLLGIGATFKMFPLLLLPVLSIIISKKWLDRILYIALGSVFFFCVAAPFLSTPNFINGVLLNAEGMGILKEISFLNIKISPFLTGYGILLIILIHKSSTFTGQSHVAWFVSLLALTPIFLFTTVPFYWLIWIMPVLIAVIHRDAALRIVWICLQIAFVFNLLGQHRELNVDLPIHLAPFFNIPNLPTTLAILNPTILKIYNFSLPFGNSVYYLALTFIMWTGFKNILHIDRQNSDSNIKFNWFWVPVALIALALAGSIYLGKDLVTQNFGAAVQSKAIGMNDTVVQSFSSAKRDINGIRLRFFDETPNASLTLCSYDQNDFSSSPLACKSKNIGDFVENQQVYFRFDQPVSALPNQTLFLKINILTVNTKVTLPYSINNIGDRTLGFNSDNQAGSLDFSPVVSLNSDDYNALLFTNVIQDRGLMRLLGIAILGTGMILFWMIKTGSKSTLCFDNNTTGTNE